MMAVQTCRTFVEELEALGVTIPTMTNQIKIRLVNWHMPVEIVFHVCLWDGSFNLQKLHIYKSDGAAITCGEFYCLAKPLMNLPDECVNLEILAEFDNITTMTINAALPQKSLSFLKGFTFA